MPQIWNLSRLGRKARKFLRNPGTFLDDALSKRSRPRSTSPNVAPAAESVVRPEHHFELDYLSFHHFLVELSQHLPLLEIGPQKDVLSTGVLKKDLQLFLQCTLDYASRFGIDLDVRQGDSPSHQLTRESELQLAANVGDEFYIDWHYGQYRLAELRVVTYRSRGEILVTSGSSILKNLPSQVSTRLLSGDKGMFSTSDLLGCVARPTDDRDIDLVFTWVNSKDPKWSKMYLDEFGVAPDTDRFLPRDELRYSLRSALSYCGWFRHIFIVSNCAPPPWLDLNHPSLSWIQHEEILPLENLPTFNSHAIEANLHSIPDLADHFIYFNDDVFVLSPLRKEAFFDIAGRSIAFHETEGFLARDRQVPEEEWVEARLEGQEALLAETGYAATTNAKHAPYAISRRDYVEMLKRFSNEFLTTSASRERSPSDIPLLTFLYGHYQLAMGRGLREHPNVEILTLARLSRFTLSQDARFLCINDGGGSSTDSDFDSFARKLMKERFPIASPWEKSTLGEP